MNNVKNKKWLRFIKVLRGTGFIVAIILGFIMAEEEYSYYDPFWVYVILLTFYFSLLLTVLEAIRSATIYVMSGTNFWKELFGNKLGQILLGYWIVTGVFLGFVLIITALGSDVESNLFWVMIVSIIISPFIIKKLIKIIRKIK